MATERKLRGGGRAADTLQTADAAAAAVAPGPGGDIHRADLPLGRRQGAYGQQPTQLRVSETAGDRAAR